MNSIEEVYQALKPFDTENRLFLHQPVGIMELKFDAIRSVLVGNDYYVVLINKEEWSHEHWNFDEIYEELLGVLQGEIVLPTDAMIRAKSIREKLILAFGAFMIILIVITSF